MFVIGDAHGQFDAIRRLLRESAIVDAGGRWAAGDAHLWFTGDFCDRGPAGMEIVHRVRQLQHDAERQGGSVRGILGNHDIMLVAAKLFPDHRASFGSTFPELWTYNGGRDHDLAALDGEAVRWLSALPALAREDGVLLMHCDATFYLEFGSSIEEVNATVRGMMESNDPRQLERLLIPYFDRERFIDRNRGADAVSAMLDTFGGTAIVHGHTPIPHLAGVPARAVTAPFRYAGGRCIDVDGGLYMGGPGFVAELRDGTLVSAELAARLG